ncbi:MAG: YggS family pyridoxal phosphate-dependent enzyme [Rhodothermales bacterium]
MPETLAERLSHIQSRIADACARAHREAEEVTLVAVSKTFPLERIEAAREAGLAHFGENKVQELTAKSDALPGTYQGGAVQWHMIGHLQRNKAKEIVACTDLFHGLDSPRLANELNKRAEQIDRVMPCLVQVNVSGEASKFGVAPDMLTPLLDAIAALPHLRIDGLMTLAAPSPDPERVRSQFALLRQLAEQHRRHASNIDLQHLSMGMSGDFEVAIEEGATLVRIGSALFGARDYS